MLDNGCLPGQKRDSNLSASLPKLTGLWVFYEDEDDLVVHVSRVVIFDEELFRNGVGPDSSVPKMAEKIDR